tara:strand:+ start:218 stop:538 length:321 start_codon:yes stop_codon:yes gene_type:complete
MKVSDLGTVRKERDYYQSSLAFEIGASHTSMIAKMSEASSIDLLNCYGPTNRLIMLLTKIKDRSIKDREELEHYEVKRNCLYIELSKRLLAFEVLKETSKNEEQPK